MAGYADSEGYSPSDPVRPNAWKYRDYVIRAFNADKPFDRFIREQLAGDELVKPPYRNLSPDDVERLTATGFLRMAPDGTGLAAADEQKTARNQVVADTIKVVSSAFLGLTVGCAQCHNHRYDPIPQSDYYRLRALFEPAYDPASWKPPAGRQVSLLTDADRAEGRRDRGRGREARRGAAQADRGDHRGHVPEGAGQAPRRAARARRAPPATRPAAKRTRGAEEAHAGPPEPERERRHALPVRPQGRRPR